MIERVEAQADPAASKEQTVFAEVLPVVEGWSSALKWWSEVLLVLVRVLGEGLPDPGVSLVLLDQTTPALLTLVV